MEVTDEIIDLWVENNIDRAEFRFSCGGDSMGDTELVFIDKDGEVVTNDTLFEHFDNEVYRNVQFYDNSDGHYLGEFGTVEINLEDNDFTYSKSALAEFSEQFRGIVNVELTQQEFEFLKDHVSFMRSTDWDGNNILYKHDLIITDEIESLIGELYEKFELALNEDFDPDVEGEYEEGSNIYTTSEDVGDDMEFFQVNGVNFIKLHCAANYVITTAFV